MRHFEKELGVPVTIARCFGPTPGVERLVLSLCCNHTLSIIPEGVQEKAALMMKEMEYPEVITALWYLEYC